MNDNWYDLILDQDTTKATITLTAKIGETDVPLPIETDACAKNRLPCPLKKNQKYTLKYDWTLPKALPTVIIIIIIIKLKWIIIKFELPSSYQQQ